MFMLGENALLGWRFKWIGVSILLAAIPLYSLLPETWTLFELSNSGMTVNGVVVESATPNKTLVYEYVVGGKPFVGGGREGVVKRPGASGLVKGAVVAVTYLPAEPALSRLGNAREQFQDDAFLLACVILVATFLGYWIGRHGLPARWFR